MDSDEPELEVPPQAASTRAREAVVAPATVIREIRRMCGAPSYKRRKIGGTALASPQINARRPPWKPLLSSLLCGRGLLGPYRGYIVADREWIVALGDIRAMYGVR
ncbi:hypothetical protein GCM10027162_32410 [Streptomyces incanus]